MAIGFDDLRQAIIERAQTIFDDATEEVLEETRQAAPIKTGELRGSIQLGSSSFDGSHFSRRLASDKEYAVFTDLGTRPHRIPTSGRGPVAFYWPNGPRGPGNYVFDHVNHPGTQGTQWFAAEIGNRYRVAILKAVQ